MGACADRMESLLLDVHGEISPEQRQQWEAHLKSCRSCSEERQRLLRLLELVREEMRDPELSLEAEARLLRSISSAVEEECRLVWWQRVARWMPLRSIPALAAGFLLILALGWFGLRGGDQTIPLVSSAILESEERMIVEEIDLLEQLDLLEEMDIVQNLVKIVDNREARL